MLAQCIKYVEKVILVEMEKNTIVNYTNNYYYTVHYYFEFVIKQ